MRQRFVDELGRLLDEDARVVVVLAAISAGLFEAARARHPQRVVDVGIREQSLLGVAAGLAHVGLRPVVHTFAPFLLERPFEQLKLDLCHQGLGATLVSVGASYDFPEYGTSHFCPEDVALLDALPGIEVHVPGHPDEAATLLRHAVAGSGVGYVRLSESANSEAVPTAPGRMRILRSGELGSVIAVGPMLDPVLAAVEGMDLTVIYANTVRPWDRETVLGSLGRPAVAVVEPYQEGTSVGVINEALGHVPHRILGLGVGRRDLHRYGRRAEHDRAHGLDPTSLRMSLSHFFGVREPLP